MQQLTTRDAVDSVLEQDTAILYKHSTHCPISAAALQEVERFRRTDSRAPIYLVDVIAHRDVARYVAERTGIRHESPQAILLQDGEPMWHASHFNVTAAALERELQALHG